MKEKFLEAIRLITKAEKILCISHKRPDGDTLGASISWGQLLKGMGKNVIYGCIDDLPERFRFLIDSNKFVKSFDFKEFDLIIVSDAGASYMTKYQDIYPDIWSGLVPVINIDHHASNDNFGTVNIVDPAAASTTLLMYRLFSFANYTITPAIATALLCGIYNDTGSLMHSNTCLEVFEVTGKLMELGGRLNVVAKSLFRNTSVAALKMWGKAMENIRVNEEGVAVSVLTLQDFKDANATEDDISGVVDMLNSIPGTRYTCLLNEDAKGNIKGSFRTRRDDVDVAEIASKFGGGGHKKAAGFTMPGRLQREVHWKIVPEKRLPNDAVLDFNSTNKLLKS